LKDGIRPVQCSRLAGEGAHGAAGRKGFRKIKKKKGKIKMLGKYFLLEKIWKTRRKRESFETEREVLPGEGKNVYMQEKKLRGRIKLLNATFAPSKPASTTE